MRAALLAVFASLAACNSQRDDNWIEIEKEGDDALYLDKDSIEGTGNDRVFWTKYAATDWRSGPAGPEIRRKYAINCVAKTFRVVEGGLYKDGRLKRPVEKLGSGVVGSTGYAKRMYDRVCALT